MGSRNQSTLLVSDDARQVIYNGTHYAFNKSEARAFQVLLKTWQLGIRARKGSVILLSIGSRRALLGLVFKHKSKCPKRTWMHPAWGTLIIHTRTPELNGYYQLNLEPGTVISRITEEDFAIPPPPVSTRKRWRKRIAPTILNGSK